MVIEFTYRFEAAHRFLNSQSLPCMTPHGHTWYATLLVRYLDSTLDNSQMTVEFGQLKKGWKQLIQGTFDHSYLHNIKDPVVEALGDQGARLVPFPGDPTTELISLFLFHKMETIFKQESFNDLVRIDGVRVQETPTNTILCDRPFYQSQISKYSSHNAWWNSQDLSDRHLKA